MVSSDEERVRFVGAGGRDYGDYSQDPKGPAPSSSVKGLHCVLVCQEVPRRGRGLGSQGIKFSPQSPHSLLCVCAAQETERAAAVTLIQMTCLLNPSLQPDQLSHMERSMLRDDYPPQVSLTVPETHPGP